jgi:hypothetical protein
MRYSTGAVFNGHFDATDIHFGSLHLAFNMTRSGCYASTWDRSHPADDDDRADEDQRATHYNNRPPERPI